MATSLFQKLIKNQSRYHSITKSITISHLTTSTAAAAAAAATSASKTHYPLFPTHQSVEPKSQDSILFDPISSFGIYPSFSFEHFLNPVIPFAPEEVNGTVSDKEDEGSNTMYADSVKKKRKKKMNKHKLKKLRKRLRRKT